jgi:hypothetical protein
LLTHWIRTLSHDMTERSFGRCQARDRLAAAAGRGGDSLSVLRPPAAR